MPVLRYLIHRIDDSLLGCGECEPGYNCCGLGVVHFEFVRGAQSRSETERALAEDQELVGSLEAELEAAYSNIGLKQKEMLELQNQIKSLKVSPLGSKAKPPCISSNNQNNAFKVGSLSARLAVSILRWRDVKANHALWARR